MTSPLVCFTRRSCVVFLFSLSVLSAYTSFATADASSFPFLANQTNDHDVVGKLMILTLDRFILSSRSWSSYFFPRVQGIFLRFIWKIRFPGSRLFTTFSFSPTVSSQRVYLHRLSFHTFLFLFLSLRTFDPIFIFIPIEDCI